jgi:outer membrane receptor protein involved in Fe transport
MRIRMSAAIAVLSLLCTSAALAQETTGTLAGRLIDAQGLAVPGATVTVTGPQGARSFITDGEGRFHAPFLTPGAYDVRAELQGFKATETKGVSVSLGQTTEVNLKMEIGGLTETVEVTAAQTIVDTRSTTTGAVLSSDLLSKVPVGRRMSDTLYLAPGVASSGSAGRANPSISGGSGLDNQYVIDGVNVTNTGYGALGSYSIIFGSLGNSTPYDFIKEVQVKTGGYEAEYGQATGGVVNVVTKSGSNQLRGTAFGYTRPEQLEGGWKTFQTQNGTVQTLSNQLHDVGLEVSGRIIPNRLFFFGAINPAFETRTFQAPEGFPLEQDGGWDRKRQNTNYSAKVTYQIVSNHRIDASFFGDPSTGELGPQRVSALEVQTPINGSFTTQFSELSKFGGNNQTVRYDGVMSPTWLLEASFANARNQIEELPSVDEWRVIDRRGATAITSGGIGFFEAGNDSKNQQFKVKSSHITSGHQFSYGFQYENVEFSQINDRTGPSYTAHDGRQTATGAQVNIIPDLNFGTIYRVDRANFNTGRSTTQQYYNLFIQDSWRVSDRLTINPGIRYEQEKLSGTLVENFELKNNWAPRIGIIYDPLGNGRSKLYGNWGRFYARIPNDLAARALSADDGVSREDFFDAALTRPIPNGVPTQQDANSGVITNHFALAGQFPSVIDPDAKLSYKDEFVVGYEFEAFRGANLGVRYIHRNIGRVLEDVANAPMVAYDLGLPGIETVEYILTNPSPDTATVAPQLGATFEAPIHNYDAVEFTLNGTFSSRFTGTASYRWSRLHGTFEGFYREDNGQSDPGITSLYDFPTNDPSYTAIGVPQFGYTGDIRFLGDLGKGPLPLDRPHQVKLFGSFSVTDALGVGLGVNTSSGKPLTPLAANPNYHNGGEIPLGPRGSGIETLDGFKKRTPMEFQVDANASYTMRFGPRRLTLLADAFNLFNLRRTLDYDNWTDLAFEDPNVDFGTPTSQLLAGPQFQAPFSLRLGARFEW